MEAAPLGKASDGCVTILAVSPEKFCTVGSNFHLHWDGASIPRRAAGVEASRVGGELVVLDPEGRTLRGLNATAARAWELVDGHRTAEQIASTVGAEFGAGADARVLEDVLAFFQVMAARGLLDGGAR